MPGGLNEPVPETIFYFLFAVIDSALLESAPLKMPGRTDPPIAFVTGVNHRWGGPTRRLAFSLPAFAFFFALTSAHVRAQDKIAAPPAAGVGAKAGDLTGLSLEELYNLDVVQLNVLGGHTHPAGQTMFGYQYMHVNMEGNFKNTREVSPAEVFADGFHTMHTQMEMDMHMVEVMHAPTDRLTLMAMLPYKEMTMKHLTDMGTRFKQTASGIGDVEVMGLYTLFGSVRGSGHRLILNGGVSFPTGSTAVKDHANGDPSQPEVKLEYPMQLGSGTYDLLPGLTYLGDSGPWSWGAQTLESVRLGRNSSGYRFGNDYRLSLWTAYGLTDWLAPSVRVDGRWWENIHGSDPAYGAVPHTPEARADLREGRRVDLLFGVGLYAPKGMLKGTRLMVEGGLPVYQWLKGPQLGTAWMLNLSATYAF